MIGSRSLKKGLRLIPYVLVTGKYPIFSATKVSGLMGFSI
jgi:hypothetical protein